MGTLLQVDHPACPTTPEGPAPLTPPPTRRFERGPSLPGSETSSRLSKLRCTTPCLTTLGLPRKSTSSKRRSVEKSGDGPGRARRGRGGAGSDWQKSRRHRHPAQVWQAGRSRSGGHALADQHRPRFGADAIRHRSAHSRRPTRTTTCRWHQGARSTSDGQGCPSCADGSAPPYPRIEGKAGATNWRGKGSEERSLSASA